MKVKLEIAETVWSEIIMDNVESIEEAKQRFYDNYDNLDKYSKQKNYVCDNVDVYDYNIITEKEDE